MQEYHKIQTVFNRDPATKYKTVIEGDYSLPEFEYLSGNNWIFTEKVDGTNIRIGIVEDRLDIRGRTDNAQIPTFLLSRLMEIFNVAELKNIFGGPFCFYGEGYGKKIQKGGGNYLPDRTDFVLFDIKVGDWWLSRVDVEIIAYKLGLRVVPIIGSGTLSDLNDIVSSGFVSQWGDFQAEGIVARPETELFNRAGKRIITKLKCKDFRESLREG